MMVIADTHVHLYPSYDTVRLLDGLHARLSALAPGAVQAAFLTEGKGFRAFDDLSGRFGAWTVEPSPEPGCLLATCDDDAEMYIVAGRQIVTRERIEILALATSEMIADGQIAHATVNAVLEAGGVPVVAWAPGKWFFGRGKIVASLIESCDPGQLAVGDTILRATCWAEPLLMRAARRRGCTVLAGSDPLPFAGEEVRAGTYATVLEGAFDKQKPRSSLRELLQTGSACTMGRRNGPVLMLQRLRKNAAT